MNVQCVIMNNNPLKFMYLERKLMKLHKINNKTILVLSLMLTIFTVTVSAQVTNFSATIDTAQANPAVDPTTPAAAGGSATVRFNSVTNILSWDISYANLSGPVTAFHFHGPAGPGANGPVQISLADFGSLNSPIVGSTVITPVQAGYLSDGMLYLNAHTALNPAGELRGQVIVVPRVIPTLSATNLMLLILALFIVAFYSYKKVYKKI
jgi:hypothetical protein